MKRSVKQVGRLVLAMREALPPGPHSDETVRAMLLLIEKLLEDAGREGGQP